MKPLDDSVKYADIMELPHHQSLKRPHMPMEDRAAQFSPFAALTGYEDAVKETARLTEGRLELDEYQKEVLDRQLSCIRDALCKCRQKGRCRGEMGVEITVTYFVPDERKEGGMYLTQKGMVQKLKEYEQILLMEDGKEIPLAEIVELRMMKDSEN